MDKFQQEVQPVGGCGAAVYVLRERDIGVNDISTTTITCPECGFSRELPSERIPDTPVQVTCPRCRGSFPFTRQKPMTDAPSTEQIAAVVATTGTQPEHVTPPPRPSPPDPRPQPTTGGGSRASTIRIAILCLLLVAAIVYALRDNIPLQRLRAAAAPGRQVIVIPPPVGVPPALPTGSMSVKATSGEPSPTGTHFEPYDFPVFIYAVNLTGKIRVNGHEYREIKGEPDMQYSINAYGEPFRYGTNSIELDLAPAAGENGSMNPELRMKVSRLVGGIGGERRVIGEWQFAGQSGWPRTISLEIPEVSP